MPILHLCIPHKHYLSRYSLHLFDQVYVYSMDLNVFTFVLQTFLQIQSNEQFHGNMYYNFQEIRIP